MTMKKILFILACALCLVSCENFFINKNLGGDDWVPTDVRTVSYTLTDADYTAITKYTTNINIALGLEEDSVAYNKLKLVDSVKYFENDSVAAYYLPAFIADKFSYLDAGSIVKIAFQMSNPAPDYMALLDTIHTFNIADEVYTNVWGANVEVPYLTPATEGKLLEMVQKSYSDTLADGVYAIQYDYSEIEPSYSVADETLVLTHEEYLDLVKYVVDSVEDYESYFSKKDLKYESFEVDYYLGSNSKHNYINTNYTEWKKINKSYSLLTDAEISQLQVERLAEALINVVLPARYSTPRMGVYSVAFAMGVDQSNVKREYMTFMYAGDYNYVSCSFIGNEETSAPVGFDTLSVGTRATLFVVEKGHIDFFSADGITPLVLSPSDYQILGVNYLDRPERVLPKLLQHKYPFASFGTTYLVVYRIADGSLKAGRYNYNGTDWTVIKDSKQKISSFMNTGSVWETSTAVYLSESFANLSQGDFTLQNVLLTGSLTYVWQTTGSYGMKASAFVGNTNNPSEAWLVSPIVDLTEAEKPILIFDQARKYGVDFIDECFVMVSVNYDGDVTECDWVHIPYNQDEEGNYIVPDGSNWTFMSSGDLDLSAFAGQRITIGFKYTSSAAGSATWEVKNLVVKEKK